MSGITGKLPESAIMNRARRFIPFLLVALLAGCGYRYHVPEIGFLDQSSPPDGGRTARLAALRVADGPSDPAASWSIPPPVPWVSLPEVGDKFRGIIRVTPEMRRAIAAYVTRDHAGGLAAVAELRRGNPDPQLAYAGAILEVQILNVMGRSDAALAAIGRLADEERRLFGNNLETQSLRAEVLLWRGDLDSAEDLYARIVDAVGDWRLPAAFWWPPANFVDLGRTWVALEKATLGLAFVALLRGDYRTAHDWAARTERFALDMIELMDHPIYGLFIRPDITFYTAHGLVLAALGGARIGSAGDAAAGDELFAAAATYFRQARYPDGALMVDAIRGFVTVRAGLAPNLTRRIGVLGEPVATTAVATDRLLRRRPATVGHREGVALPLPGKGTVALPAAGERSIYGFVVTPELDDAVRAWTAGDEDAALASLAAAEAAGPAPLVAWHLSYLRAQVLIMMGRSADAESELARTARLEEQAHGTNLNARALRGEARLWLGDADAAIADFVQVLDAIGEWRVPTLWVFPPPDIPAVVAMTRASFRTHLGLAGAFMLKGDFARARAWAEEAENLLEEVFYDIHHPLYGKYTAVDSDIYAARGVNLGILAATRVATAGDPEAGDDEFAAATSYFDAIGHALGRATIDGFRVRALLHIDRADLALPLAERVAALAIGKGLSDLIWQIEALRGEALLALGRQMAAEQAFRAAQAAVGLVSGALATDRAKQRFGIGKQAITRRLADLDIARDDLDTLFLDLEEGRARAFVDLLGKSRVASGRQTARMERLRDLDQRIRRQRLLNAAPGGPPPRGLAAEQALLAERAAEAQALRAIDPELSDAVAIAQGDLIAARRNLDSGDLLAYALPGENGPLRFLLVSANRRWLVEARLTDADLLRLLEPFMNDNPIANATAQVAASADLVTDLGISAWPVVGRLYVVPSGNLHFLPWAALGLPYPVVQVPTGSWLARPPRAPAEAGRAVVVGDPDIGGDLPPLPGARFEARAVASLYATRPILGGQASEEMVRHEIGSGVQVLHLATHGKFDAVEPLRSHVLLAGLDGPTRLTAARLFEIPLAARLVVLSACETGAGTVAAGDDFLGLPRSFYLGGSEAVLASLWPVADVPTEAFMTEFHRVAIDGDYGTAWLRAHDLLRRRGYPPAVYGAFVLGGSAGRAGGAAR